MSSRTLEEAIAEDKRFNAERFAVGEELRLQEEKREKQREQRKSLKPPWWGNYIIEYWRVRAYLNRPRSRPYQEGVGADKKKACLRLRDFDLWKRDRHAG